MSDLEVQFFGTVTVGERGQIAIPQEAREKLGIHPGDKMLVVSSIFGGIAVVPEKVLTDILKQKFREVLGGEDK